MAGVVDIDVHVNRRDLYGSCGSASGKQSASMVEGSGVLKKADSRPDESRVRGLGEDEALASRLDVIRFAHA